MATVTFKSTNMWPFIKQLVLLISMHIVMIQCRRDLADARNAMFVRRLSRQGERRGGVSELRINLLPPEQVSMRRVLFVDDDSNALSALQRALRGMGGEWEMEFAQSGNEALVAFRREPFDVVVSDMRMQGMDGAELLARIKEIHPPTIRIVLSGYPERDTVLRAIGSAHRYLSKPCSIEALKATIDRTEAIRGLLGSESLRGLVTQVDSLPTLPTLFLEIRDALRRPRTSLTELGTIIAKDIGMTAKILHIVNSAYFGLPNPIANVERAVAFLGLDMINALVLTASVFSRYEGPSVPGFSAEAIWDHSVRTGAFVRVLCREMAFEDASTDQVLLAGMLHDAGKVVLAANAAERYRQVLERVARDHVGLSEAERDMFGTTHAEVGAFIVKLWDFPDPVVEAIAFHANPRESGTLALTPLTAVHVASALARELGSDTPNERGSIDLEYLETLGLAHRVPDWKEACARSLRASDPDT